MAEGKEQLSFLLEGKKFHYQGYKSKRETDFFELYIKSSKNPNPTPEDLLECYKQNFDTARDKAEIYDMYLKRRKKQEEKKKKKASKEESGGGEDSGRRASKPAVDEDYDNDKAAKVKDEKKEESAGTSSARRMVDPKFSEKEKQEIDEFIRNVIEGGDAGMPSTGRGATPLAVPNDSPATTSPRPSARGTGEGFQVKLSLEDTTSFKVISLSTSATFEQMQNQVEKKFGQKLVMSYTDEDGDIVEVDDDDALQMFIAHVEQGNKSKMLCSKPKPKNSETKVEPTREEPEPNSARPAGAGEAAKSTPGVPMRSEEIRTYTGHVGAVYCCAFNSNGSRFVSGSRDRTLKVWDRDGTIVQSIRAHNGYVLSCDFSPNNSHIVSASEDHTCRIWQAETGKKIITLRGHSDKVYCCQYSQNGQHIVSASCDKTCKVWNAETGSKVANLKGHSFAVFSCGFSSDARNVCSASDDKKLKIWDWRNSEDIGTFSGHNATVWSVCYSPDNKYLLSACMDHEIKLWDVGMRKEIRTMQGHMSPIHHAIFTHDGKNILSCARDRLIMVWDTNTGELKESIAGHKCTVYHLAIKNNCILSCSLDETLKVWKFPELT